MHGPANIDLLSLLIDASIVCSPRDTSSASYLIDGRRVRIILSIICPGEQVVRKSPEVCEFFEGKNYISFLLKSLEGKQMLKFKHDRTKMDTSSLLFLVIKIIK